MKKVTVDLVDDLDGEAIEEGNNGGTVAFSLEGSSFEIDLRSENIQRLRELFAPYVTAGRPVAAKRSSGTDSTSSGSTTAELQEIRDWARQNGLRVSDRGRIAASVREAYAAAH